MKKLISLIIALTILIPCIGVSASDSEIINWADKTVYSSVSGSCAYDVKNNKTTMDALFGGVASPLAGSGYNVELDYPKTYSEESNGQGVGTVPISKFLVDLGEEREIDFIDIYQFKDRITEIKVYEVNDVSKFNAAKNIAASITDSFMANYTTLLGEAIFDNGGNAATTLNELGNCNSPDTIQFSETKTAQYLLFTVTQTVSTPGYSKILLQKITINKGTRTPGNPDPEQPGTGGGTDPDPEQPGTGGGTDPELEDLTARPIFRDKHDNAYSKGAVDIAAKCMEGTDLESLTDLTDKTGVEVAENDSLIIDFGKEKVINLISMTQLGNKIDEYEIYYSSDESEWKLFDKGNFEVVDLDFEESQPIEMSVERESVICHYIKIVVKTLREDPLTDVAKLLSFEAYNTEDGTEVNLANSDLRNDVTGFKNTSEDTTYGYFKNVLSPSKIGYIMCLSFISSLHNHNNTFFAIDLGRVTDVNRLQLTQRKENIVNYSIYSCDSDMAWSRVSALGGNNSQLDEGTLSELTKITDGSLPDLEDYDTILNEEEKDLVSVIDFGKTVKSRYLVFVITKADRPNGGPMQWDVEVYNHKIVSPVYTPDGNESEFDSSSMGTNYALEHSVISDAGYIGSNAPYTSTEILTDGTKSDGRNIFYLGGNSPAEMILDFGQSVPTDTLVLYEYGHKMKDVVISSSNDNLSWEEVTTYTSGETEGRDANFTAITYPLTVARYIKISSYNQSGTAMLSEIEAYSSDEVAVILNSLTTDMLSDESTQCITNNLIDLPETVTDADSGYSATIIWSGGEGVINPLTGEIIRSLDEDKNVILKATLTVAETGDVFEKTFSFCVKKDSSGTFVEQKELSFAEFINTGSVTEENILSLGENSSATYTYKEENDFLIKDNFTAEFQLDSSASSVSFDLGEKTFYIEKNADETVFTLEEKEILKTNAYRNAKYKLEIVDGMLNIYIDKLNGYGYRAISYGNVFSGAVLETIDFSTGSEETANVIFVKLYIPENKLIDTVFEQFDFSKLSDDNPLLLTKNLTLISNVLKTDISYTTLESSSAINSVNGMVDLDNHGIFSFNVKVSYRDSSKSKTFKTAVGNIFAGVPVSASAVPYGGTSESSITATAHGGYYLTTASKYDITAEILDLKPITKIVVSEPSDALGRINAWSLEVSQDGKTFAKVAEGNSVGEELIIDVAPVKIKKIKFSVNQRNGSTSGIEKMLGFFTPTDIQIAKSDNNSVSVPEEINGNITLPLLGEYGALYKYELVDSQHSALLSFIAGAENYVCTVTKPENDTSVEIRITATYNGESVSKVVRTKVSGKNSVSTKPSEGGTINAGNSGSYNGPTTGGGSSGEKKEDPLVTPDVPMEENKTEKELENHWAKAEISFLMVKGIVRGDGKSLNLDSSVTRAEFIAMIVRAMEWTASENNSQFKDVKSTDWFAADLQTAYENRLFKGDGINAMPNKRITRQEAAVMLANICKAVENESKGFTDNVNISDWARDGVEKASALGLITGYEDGSFAPGKNIRRDEAMVVIYRLLTLK